MSYTTWPLVASPLQGRALPPRVLGAQAIQVSAKPQTSPHLSYTLGRVLSALWESVVKSGKKWEFVGLMGFPSLAVSSRPNLAPLSASFSLSLYASRLAPSSLSPHSLSLYVSLYVSTDYWERKSFFDFILLSTT